MLQKRPILSLALLTAALAACSPAAPQGPQQGVQGTLTVGVGGEALVGATVEALGASGQGVLAKATTDAAGHFTLGLAPGTYTLLSPGQTLTSTVNQGGSGQVPFASSQVVGVSVLDKRFTTQNLVQLPAIAASVDATPPSLSVDGLGASLDGQGSANFSFTARATNNSIYRVVAAFGKMPNIYRKLRASSDSSLLFQAGPAGEPGVTSEVSQPVSLDLRQFAAGLSGSTTLQVLVQDGNGNRSLALFPVTITNPPAGTALTGSVADLNATAFTVSNTRIQEASAPAGALVYTELSWSPYAFPTSPDATTPALGQGYHIYRSLNDGPAVLVGTRTVVLGTGPDGQPAVVNPTDWLDTDPALAPGVQASYTVRAFNGNQETPDSAPSAATVLPALTVHLTAPAENADGVSTTPTFRWQTNGVGSYEYFVPALSDTVNGGGVSSCGTEPTASPPSPLVDLLQQAGLTSARGFGFSGTLCGVVGGPAVTDYRFDYHPGSDYNAFLPPLQEGRSYQWRLLEAVATDDPQNPHALAVTFDAAGLLFAYNIYTGLYTFDGDQVYTFTTGGTK